MITEATRYTDSRAPWNQEVTSTGDTPCPFCDCTGKYYTARDIYTGDEVEVNHVTFHLLPKTYDECVARGQRWQQWEEMDCPECNGDGWI